MKKILVLFLLLVASTASLSAQSSAAPEVEELWYVVELSDAKAGWVMIRSSREGGELTTENTMHMEIRRGPAQMTLTTESRFVEKEGQPLRAWTSQALGQMPVEATWEFGPEVVKVRTLQGESVREQELPMPETAWLTPGAAEDRIREMLDKGAEEFSITTVDPQLGLQPVTTNWNLLERDDEIETAAGNIITTRWRQSQSYAPQIEMIVNIDEEGRIVRSVTPVLGMNTTLTLSTREEALLATSEGAPELLIQTFVRPDKPIEKPRKVRRAIYRLTVDGGSPEDLDVNFGRQTSEIAGQTLRLMITNEPKAPDSPENGARYLRSTLFLPHDNPLIRKLLADALPESGGAGPQEKAVALRDFVAAYVTEKDLDTVLATAAEVAESRSGDCTEHAVLLSTLLRAAGIPARVVTGLVYVQQFAGASDIFGYHMWSQALIGGRWVDLDAALGSAESGKDYFVDATHIALGTSALDDEQSILKEVAKIATVMGRLKIDVVEVDY